MRSSSFYAAMKVLPRRKREAMFAIYAFCHQVDDIADEGGEQNHQLAALNMWRAEMEHIAAGREPATYLAQSLAKICACYNLDIADFIAIIDGVEMDVRQGMRAPSALCLDLYCDRVASAVGRLAVIIFGLPAKLGLSLAHVQGRALQLTNILRDLDEDAHRGRLYMPAEILAMHGIDPEQSAANPQALLNQPAFMQACSALASQADMYFKATGSLLDMCPRHLVRPARLMAVVYRCLLAKLILENFRPNVRLSTPVKIGLILRYGLI